MQIELAALAFLAGALFLGATAKGVTGLGFPLITVPIVALFLGPRSAVVAISIPNLIVNVVMLTRGGAHPGELKRLWPILLAGIGGVAFGAKLLASLNTSFLSIVLGSLAILFVLWNLLNLNAEFQVSRRQEAVLSPTIGLLTGLLQGSTGVSGPPLAMYLHSLRLQKRSFVYLITAVFLTFNVVQVVSLYALSLYSRDTFLYAALFIVPALAGLALGLRVQDALDQRKFNLAMLLLLFVSGVDLVLRGVGIR